MRTNHFIFAITFVLLACGGEEIRVPVEITARIDPARNWYHTGQEVVLTGIVTDHFGDDVADIEVVWTAEPASFAAQGATEADPRSARFTLIDTGTVTFTGCARRTETEVVPSLCASVTARIDDGMPTLEVETPTPGMEIDDPAGILVRGSVADRGIVRVYVDGAIAELDDMGRFETTIAPQFGVNHVVVDASDGLTEVSQVQMDVLWAPAFTPATGADGTPELTLDDGIALRLGQNFFDDSIPFDPAIEPLVTEDLADILELVVTRVDVSGLIPDPVVDSPPAFVLRVTSVELGEPRAELDLTEDGADLFLRIGNMQAVTSGALTIEGASLPLTGTIHGSAVAFAHLTISKESEDAELEVAMGDLTVGIESLEGDFESAETAAVFRLAEGVLRRTLEDALLDAVRGSLDSSVPAVLRDALLAIDSALANREIPLDSAPFPPLTIQIDGRIRNVSTAFRREMIATLRTTIGTDQPNVHPDSRGVARLDTGDMTPEFFRDGSLALAVRLSVLNGLLHSLWSSGLLELDVSPLLPESVRGLVSEAHLAGLLSPVLRPARGEETHDLILSLGQLELPLTFMGEPARFAVNIEAGVNIDLTASRISISIADEPVITVWTLVPASNPRLLSESTVRELLLQLWPDLSQSIEGSLSFELPLPSLGDLGGLAPDLAGLALQIESDGRVRPRDGVLVLDARMQGTLP